MIPETPFPLAWPEGWKRTLARDRERSQFGTNFVRARDGVLHELRLMRAAKVIITSDLPVKSNGMPYATGRADDPAIAVWWAQVKADGDSKERVMACDRYLTPGENLQAIHKSIQALRGLDRWGATEVVERAFAGFTALPAGGETSHSREWWEVLEVDPSMLSSAAISTSDLTLIIKSRYREKARATHPDRGGAPDEASAINNAYEAAEKFLASRN